MRGDLPKKEPQILARWDATDLWGRLRAASTGRPLFMLHDGPPYANGNIHIGTALNKILKDVVNRTRQMAGYDANYIPGWDCHGLPIEWKIEEDYRAKKKDKDAVPVLDFRAECRAYAAHWMDVQAREFRRLGVEGDFRARYATMDPASEAAIAHEICKFLLNGALYRGLRPVMWSPVEKTALAEAEIEYHDHTSTTIWVRFPVVKAPAARTGGRRGGDLDHHPLDHARQPRRRRRGGDRLRAAPCRWRDGRLARAGRREAAGGAGAAAAVLTRTSASPCITWCTCSRARRWTASSAPIRCAAHGYDQDTPLLFGDFVTTEAGTGFVHIAPGHGEEDFDLGRKHGLEIPETVGDDGTFNAWVPVVRRRARLQGGRSGLRRADRRRRAAGARQAGAFLPAFLAVQGAADLPRHAAMVHPHGRAGAHPREGARRDRRDASSCPTRAATASARWSPAGPTGASAASAPGACRSRCSWRSAPASRCAIRRWCSASSRRSPPRARTPGMPRRRRASSARTAIPTTTSRSRTSSTCGSSPARPTPSCWRGATCPGRPICIWKAPTSIAAGSSRRCWKRSARAAARRSRRC